LAYDIPQGLAAAGRALDRANVPVAIRLDHAQNIVPVAKHTGRDRRPQNRAYHRNEAAETPHDTLLGHPRQVGHVPGVDERLDQTPVRGLPTDQQNSWRAPVCHRRMTILPVRAVPRASNRQK